ncbi:cysteine proteinase inhibitor 8-like [Phragmites australis]|uniref:cysteine proteinase inhibitor 8-like n=1 Tax=Phragmites australis TaxID=29695 RepID=UPI002D77E747|nr:cysteine proteinase inhibitor 8-like [Phragmites australis]
MTYPRQIRRSKSPSRFPASHPFRAPTPPKAPDPTMAKSLLPLLLLVSLAAVAVVPARAALGGSGRGRGPLVGGWSPIPDVSDPHIQKLGAWALGQAKQARLASDGLRFRRVVRGEQQVVSGMNYRLLVDAADPTGRSAPYVAVVYEQVWTGTRQLTSFKPASRAH